jgi:hypothetical protein
MTLSLSSWDSKRMGQKGPDVADASRSSYLWLAEGRDATTGAPQTTNDGRNAAYANNEGMLFWPTRNTAHAASTVGATLPSGTTKCTQSEVNAGTCLPGRNSKDALAKLRMRTRLSTLTHTNHKMWGATDFLRAFDPIDPVPNDIYGVRDDDIHAYKVLQNLPCVNGPGGGFITGCDTCDLPSGTPGRCSLLLDDVGPWIRERDRLAQLTPPVVLNDRYAQLLAKYPCPMERFLLRLGEARVPYNMVVAMGSKGGVKDTSEGNFYTCEYSSNAIQDADDLKYWVDRFVGGDVAPCCTPDAASSTADPCWYVAPGADVPFMRGMPDDFAAGLIRNFADRVRLLSPEALCEAEQTRYLTEIARAKAYSAAQYHARSIEALDELGRAILAKDGRRLDCKPASIRNRATGQTVYLWEPWGDLEGNAGRCSIVRVTSNLRLECGSGLQMRRLPVTQTPKCGGAPCPPLVQYQFCEQTCGAPPEREVCQQRCNDIQQRTQNQCEAAGFGRTHCTALVARELASCQQRCANTFRDYECSSNLCLTPNRCDPIANRCG